MKSAKVRKIRQKLGLSQLAFAKALGAGRQTINRWESDDAEAGRMLPVYEKAILELEKKWAP